MISNEIAKVVPGESTPPPPLDLPEPDDGESHAFYEHVDRMRYLDVQETDTEKLEMTLLKDMLTGAMPGLDEFIKDERYLVLKGKVLFNTIGIAYSGGRLNKARDPADLSDWSTTRTDVTCFRSQSLVDVLSLGTSHVRRMARQDRQAPASTASHPT
jgi:import receptor subunit TOM20